MFVVFGFHSYRLAIDEIRIKKLLLIENECEYLDRVMLEWHVIR